MFSIARDIFLISARGDLEACEIEFEPVEPEGGLVSKLIRVIRNGRGDSISRVARAPGSTFVRKLYLRAYSGELKIAFSYRNISEI
jgi:hypothetical protein